MGDPGSGGQLLAGIVIMFVYIVYVMNFHPLKHKSVDISNQQSSVHIFFMLLGAMAIKTSPTDENGLLVLDLFLTGTNIFIIGVMIAALCRCCRDKSPGLAETAKN